MCAVDRIAERGKVEGKEARSKESKRSNGRVERSEESKGRADRLKGQERR